MRKFKQKNRQKRKYTRHIPQSTLPVKGLFAGLLPMLILAIAFVTMMFINLNLRDQAAFLHPTLPTFSLPRISIAELLLPIQNLPNAFIQPTAFFVGLMQLFFTLLQTLFVVLGKGIIAFVIQDPRPAFGIVGEGFVAMFASMGEMAVLTIGGFGRVGELFAQSMSTVGSHWAAGAQTISAVTIEYAIRAANIITISSIFVADKLIWFFGMVFHIVATVLLFIVTQLSAFVDAVINVILIPFQILGEFGMKMKPYTDILGAHIGMAGADLMHGFASFEELSSAVNP